MWIAVLLITHVAGEWVEISQQYYRKPVRITFQTTESSEVYANTTISPAIWTDHHKSSKPNTGNRRMEISSNEDAQKAEIGNNAFKHEAMTKRYEVNKDFAGTVEKVTNVGKIKRIQLSTSPVKSPAVGYNVNYANLKNVFTNHEVSTEPEEYREDSINNFKTQYISSTEDPFRIGISQVSFKNYSLIKSDEHNYFTSGKIKDINDNFNTKHKDTADLSKIKIDKIAHIEPVRKPNTKIMLDSSNTGDKSIKNFNFEIPDYITSEKTFNKNENTKLNERNNIQYRKANPTVKSNQKDGPDQFEEARIKYTSGSTEETLTSKTKANTMEVLLKIMRTVADTISKNSHRSLNSKMKYLHQLKNTILDNIENRIDSIWPDDTDTQDGVRQGARFTRETARGHVEFPSSESALMTISFLTFAVFLIKLVLQVIQTYKNKTMMVAPLVVATAGRAALQRLRPNDKPNI